MDALMMSVESMWQQFAAAVSIPMNGVQWTESRRCFYAGITVLISQLNNMPDDEKKAVEQLVAWAKQCAEFNRRIQEGKA